MALGHTNGEIADQLFLSRRTIETHRANIQRKLDLSTRAELTRYAIEHKLLRGLTVDPTARRLVTILHELLDVDELEEVLRRVLSAAQELTGARYAALGVLNGRRDGLARFLTVGVEEDERRVIGDLPHGRGVLGEIITHPRILRLADVSRHPRSYGFPHAHPTMTTFLGGPIVIRGEIYGNLYLTEKAGGAEFDEADEQMLSVLAEYAAIGIHHARRLESLESRRDELERTVAALGATSEIARALAVEVDLDPILELVAKRGRALVAARALVILLPVHGGLRVAHGAGELPDDLIGQTVGETSLAAGVMDSGEVQRLDDLDRTRFAAPGLGPLGLEAESGLYVPLAFRGRSLGLLVALDRARRRPALQRRRRAGAHVVRDQQPRPRWAPHRPWVRTAGASGPTPRKPNDGAGPASCTTRRCRASPPCA